MELARHGARSHYMKSPIFDENEDYFGEGVGPGEVTNIGRVQHLKNGLARRREYIHAKKFLDEEYNPN